MGFLLLVVIVSALCWSTAREYTGREYITLPNFFLIGAGKCGTTSLHELIVEHPQICRTTTKEFHYFSGEGNWAQGHSWYIQQFKDPTDCSEGKYLIDGTPRYIRSDVAPKRVRSSYSAKELANKKFILLLREPVSREFSWYKHRVRACLHTMHKVIRSSEPKEITKGKRTIVGYHRNELCADSNCQSLGCDSMPAMEHGQKKDPQTRLHDFDTYVHEKELHLPDSEYVNQIRNWLKYINRSQLFIISIQTLTVNTTDTMTRLSQFLGLNHDWGKNVTLPHRNENHVSANISCAVYDRLAAHYKVYNEELYALVNSGNRSQLEPYFPRFKDTRSACTV